MPDAIGFETHLTNRTGGKRQPALREATSVGTEVFSDAREGPSTNSFVHRGHLWLREETKFEVLLFPQVDFSHRFVVILLGNVARFTTVHAFN